MASTYNFTVRAEDDQGAFADRDFSIVVKNTSVDRYMVVDATDAYTSPDMVTWTKRNGQGGNAVSYGGGKWLIHYGPSAGSTTYRISNDGVNFANSVFSIQSTRVTNLTEILHIPTWNNGYWWVMGKATITGLTGSFYVLLKSADAVTWNLCCYLGVNVISINNFAPSFHDGRIYYNALSPLAYYSFDMSLNEFSSATYPFTLKDIPLSLSGFGNMVHMSPPRKINDLWISGAMFDSALVHFYSTDLITWYRETNTIASLPFVSLNKVYDQYTYINGVIYCYARSLTSASSGLAYYMSDDGKSWKFSPSTSMGSINAYMPNGVKMNVVMAKGKTYFITSNIFNESNDLGETGITPTNNPSVSAQFPVASINGFAAIQ